MNNYKEEQIVYDSDKNKLGWIVGTIGLIYLFTFVYFTLSNNIQSQVISGVSMLVILIIAMLIFKFTEFKTRGIN